jgi:mRNA interferase MazF
VRGVHSGEVHRARLDPTEGSEQSKTRPVIVLQNPDLERFTSTVLCIPLTTNMTRLGLPGTCLIPQGEAGLGQESVALAFQMRALDASRLGKRFGKVSAETLEAVADAALNALGVVIES